MALGGPRIVVTIAGLATVLLTGAQWSTGVQTATTSLGSLTVMGSAMGPGGLTSSTALGGGTVQMVSPIRVTTTSGGPPTSLGFFGVFNAQMVPEPGAALMLVSGAGALLLLGQARRN